MVSVQFCINPIQPVQTIKISPTKKKEKEDFVPPSFAAPLLLLVVPVEVGVANQIGVSPFLLFSIVLVATWHPCPVLFVSPTDPTPTQLQPLHTPQHANRV
jgi:hypothetical protein